MEIFGNAGLDFLYFNRQAKQRRNLQNPTRAGTGLVWDGLPGLRQGELEGASSCNPSSSHEPGYEVLTNVHHML
jgi:hypothetical protein